MNQSDVCIFLEYVWILVRDEIMRMGFSSKGSYGISNGLLKADGAEPGISMPFNSFGESKELSLETNSGAIWLGVTDFI